MVYAVYFNGFEMMTQQEQVAFVKSLWYEGFDTLAHCVARFYGIVVDINN